MLIAHLYQLLFCACCYREAEAKRQAVLLEQQRAAEEEERKLAAQRAQREAERQALKRLQKSFAVRMEGSVSVERAPKVTSYSLACCC